MQIFSGSLHEVQGPDQVDLCSFAKWLAFAGNDALFGAPLKVEFHIAIHPVHFLVVPSLTIDSITARLAVGVRTFGIERL